MREGQPSRTAWSAAVHRAVHQRAEAGAVFPDPFAVAMVGADEAGLDRAAAQPHRLPMRLMIAARSRFAADRVQVALAAGVDQVVVLGTGLDTTALRLAGGGTEGEGGGPDDGAHRSPPAGVRVFEVDHPASQAWREQVLDRAGLTRPACAVPVPVDFEAEAWVEALGAAGFEADRPAAVLWLGVVPYLSRRAVQDTLGQAGGLAPGSFLVLDYALPAHLRSRRAQSVHARRAERVAAVGEPWLTFFTPEALAASAGRAGLRVEQDRAVSDVLAEALARPAGRESATRLAVLVPGSTGSA